MRSVTIFLWFFSFLSRFASTKKDALSGAFNIFSPCDTNKFILLSLSYVSALICTEDCAYSSLFSLLSRANSAGSLKGSSIRLRREEFMQMIVTSKAENKIQAATIEIIMTVMAYSLIHISSSKPIIPECELLIVPNCPTWELSA